MAGEVQRRGRTNSHTVHCNPTISYRATESPSRTMKPTAGRVAGHPQTQEPTRVHCEMRETILQEFSVSKIHFRMSRNAKSMHRGREYKMVQAPRKQVAAPEPVQCESHQTSNFTLGVYPKEWKAGYLSKYPYRNVQSSKAYNSQRWEKY